VPGASAVAVPCCAVAGSLRAVTAHVPA